METLNNNVTAPSTIDIQSVLDSLEKANKNHADALVKIADLKEKNADLLMQVNVAIEKQGTVAIYSDKANCSNLTLEEAKREIENFYKEKYDKNEETAVGKLVKMQATLDAERLNNTVALDRAKVEYANNLEKANIQNMRAINNAENANLRKIQILEKDLTLMTEKYESLKENKQYESRLDEIEALKKQLKKAKSKLINLGAFWNWLS